MGASRTEGDEGAGDTVTLDRLIEACPSFLGATALFDYLRWSEEEDSPDQYLRTAALAQHIVDLIARREVDELPGLFATVDEVLATGDRDAVDLVRLGLIETLQNVCSHDDVAVDAETVSLVLGPRAAAVWRDIDEVWSTAASRVSPEGPRVTEDDYRGVDDPNLKTYLRTTRRRRSDGVLVSAADVLRYEHWVADITWRSPQARRRINRTALLVGLVLAVALAIILWR